MHKKIMNSHNEVSHFQEKFSNTGFQKGIEATH